VRPPGERAHERPENDRVDDDRDPRRPHDPRGAEEEPERQGADDEPEELGEQDRAWRTEAAQRLLDDLERLAAQEPVDLDRFFATSGELRLLTPHLSPVQCARANRAWRLLAARHEERTGMPLVVVPFLPRRRDPAR